jgi:hypothetical protein
VLEEEAEWFSHSSLLLPPELLLSSMLLLPVLFRVGVDA